MSELPARVADYFVALNEERYDLLEQVWAPDVELRAVGTRPRRGRKEVMGYYRGLFDPWETHEDRPTRCVQDDGVAVVEVRFTGSTAAGNQVSFDAVDVFDLEDGAVTRLSIWYDLVWVRGQL